MKPLLAATATEASDEQLVAAAREGSDEAFEALFRRYRDRVVGYVRGMVSDHGRAEDIVQEAFMSALRSLRRTDQEIVFRPWIYEIAKNACIDHLRRVRRTQEVSIDSDDFSPVEEGRISQSTAETDAAVVRRNELESLRMAFHDLPSSQHQILVMRELEGLSYDKIGRRMGLTRGAVESMLFRARRRLRDGFDEIETGQRCLRMHAAMDAVAGGTARARDRRRLSSHLQDCKACRRHAVAMGLDSLVLVTPRSRGRRAADRVAGLLPLPAFLRRRIDDASVALNSAAPALEHGTSLAGKATAVVLAAALAVGGATITHKATGGDLMIGGSDRAGAPPGPGGTDGGGTAKGNGASAAIPGAGGGAFGGSGSGASGGVPGGPGGPLGPGGLPLPGGGPGAGGVLQAPARTVESGTGADPTGLGSLTGDTVKSLGSGDAGGTVKRLGDTVDGAPKTVKKVTGEATKQLPKVELKPKKGTVVPEAKVQLPEGGSVDTPGNGGSPSVTLPQPQLPSTDTSGLNDLPLVGDTLSSTGLGL